MLPSPPGVSLVPPSVLGSARGQGAGVGSSRMSARVGGAEASRIGREGPSEPIWQTKIQAARELLSVDALSKLTPAVQEDTSPGGCPRGASPAPMGAEPLQADLQAALHSQSPWHSQAMYEVKPESVLS